MYPRLGTPVLDDQHSCVGSAGRNRSLSGGVQGSGHGRESKTQLKWNSAWVVVTLSHLASSTIFLQHFFACRW